MDAPKGGAAARDWPLFRPEAAHAQAQRQLGTIVVANRWASWLLALSVLCLMAGLLALLIRGEYTRRAAVSGYLIPSAGVSRVHSPLAGRIKAVHVREGQLVTAGTPLVVVMDERVGADGLEARTSVSRQIELREASLYRSMAQQTALYSSLRQGLSRRMEALSQELEQLQGEIATQRSRVRYAEATRKRYLELSRQGYVSANAEQERADAVLEQQARLQSLERGRTSLERELLSLRSEWEALPIRERSQLSELERAVTEAAQDGIENHARTEVVVVAQKSGRVSGLTAEVGQPASPERPLLCLVPDGSALEAHLFAPSRDIGFVRPGQAVMMRFSAFPYQKFGHQRGVITEVSRTPLGSTELAYPVAAKSEAPMLGATPSIAALPAEPVFRIKVRLERQSVMAQGQDHALQPGMQLDADVLLDRRTLFEWVFETAYSLRGKYAS